MSHEKHVFPCNFWQGYRIICKFRSIREEINYIFSNLFNLCSFAEMNKFRIKTKKHMKVVGPFQENSS